MSLFHHDTINVHELHRHKLSPPYSPLKDKRHHPGTSYTHDPRAGNLLTAQSRGIDVTNSRVNRHFSDAGAKTRARRHNS